MFAANAKLEICPRCPAAGDSLLHEFSYTGLIKTGKRVLIVNLFSLVFVLKQPHVVSG
jgi:hypothetical protein